MRSGTTNDERLEKTRNLNKSVRKAVLNFKPPEQLTVSDWSDKYRRLSAENSAEAGPWRTSRTPYLKEIMDAFTDPRVHRIAVVASSQVGKTEMEMNMMAYMIDIDPGPPCSFCLQWTMQKTSQSGNCTDDSGHEAAAEENCDVKKP